MPDQEHEQFIPPPADEPIPQPPPEGATDYGLGGVEVPLEEMAEEERAFVAQLSAAAAALPTWTAFFSFLNSLVTTWAPGRKRENVNDYTHWYYNSWNIAAAWCFIIISRVLDHFGMLGQIGGKRAWVPDLKKVRTFGSGASGMGVGDLVAVNGYGHIGICTYRSGSTFHLWSGNSVKDNSTDAVTVKSYSTSIVNGHAKLTYAPADPSRYPGKIYKYVKSSLMHDSHVTWIQQRLGIHGHKVTVDGYYGPATAVAVKAFQKDAKLTQDSQVGPKTWTALAK
jgi:hypothetical protein